MTDRQITCVDCRNAFTFSVKEQEFFEQKNFEDPKRCPRCRLIRRERNFGNQDRFDSSNFVHEYNGNCAYTSSHQQNGNHYNNRQNQSYRVTCSSCGNETTVPFEPKANRAVYCKVCLHKRSPVKGSRHSVKT